MTRKIPQRQKPTRSLEEKDAEQKAAKEAQEKAEKKRLEKEKRVKRSFIQVAKTEAGREVFRTLMAMCGFHRPSINVDPKSGEIFTDNTVYNEARRNLYLKIRELIPPKDLVKIEFNLEAEQNDDD